MGGRGLVSCEQLDTNDNTPEVEEYDEEARRRAEAAELARDFEVHTKELLEAALDAMPKLKKGERAAVKSGHRHLALQTF